MFLWQVAFAAEVIPAEGEALKWGTAPDWAITLTIVLSALILAYAPGRMINLGTGRLNTDNRISCSHTPCWRSQIARGKWSSSGSGVGRTSTNGETPLRGSFRNEV